MRSPGNIRSTECRHAVVLEEYLLGGRRARHRDQSASGHLFVVSLVRAPIQRRSLAFVCWLTRRFCYIWLIPSQGPDTNRSVTGMVGCHRLAVHVRTDHLIVLFHRLFLGEQHLPRAHVDTQVPHPPFHPRLTLAHLSTRPCTTFLTLPSLTFVLSLPFCIPYRCDACHRGRRSSKFSSRRRPLFRSLRQSVPHLLYLK